MIIALQIIGAVVGGWLVCGLLALLLCSINERLIDDENFPLSRQASVSRLQWPKRTILLWGLVSLLVSGWIMLVNGQTLGGYQVPPEL